MALKFFTIPVHDSAAAEAELNAFLGSHRVLAFDRRFVDQGSQSFWAISVDFLVGSPEKGTSFGPKERVDYKEKLTAIELELQPKPEPYANRTLHGMDFLGCQLFPSHLVPNRRSRVRFRRKWQALSDAYENGAIGELDFQNRATSLVSFLKMDGVASCRFRMRTLFSEEVSGREARPG